MLVPKEIESPGRTLGWHSNCSPQLPCGDQARNAYAYAYTHGYGHGSHRRLSIGRACNSLAGRRPSREHMNLPLERSRFPAPRVTIATHHATRSWCALLRSRARGALLRRWHLAATGMPPSEPRKSRTFCVHRLQKVEAPSQSRGADAPARCSLCGLSGPPPSWLLPTGAPTLSARAWSTADA